MMLLAVEETWSLVWTLLRNAALEVVYPFVMVQGNVDSALVSDCQMCYLLGSNQISGLSR